MRRCYTCGDLKALEAFAFRSKATGKRAGRCRACHATARRAHYRRTKAVYIENERLRVRGHRERNRALLVAYLLVHPCVDCGETDPVALEFDHRDPSMKRSEVAKLATRHPWETVATEIAKCDVRCVSCHRRRTAKQFGWRRAALYTNAAALGARAPAVADDVLAPARNVAITGQRTCTSCGLPQPLGQFALKNAKTRLRSHKCQSCQRVYARGHYAKNRQVYLGRARTRRKTGRDRFAAVLLEYFRDHPCVDCGTTDPIVLEFDHRDGDEKLATINALVRRLDWSGLVAEIAKCDVRCANCHRKRTARQFGWARLRPDSGTAV